MKTDFRDPREHFYTHAAIELQDSRSIRHKYFAHSDEVQEIDATISNLKTAIARMMRGNKISKSLDRKALARLFVFGRF